MALIVSSLAACSFFQPYQPELKQGNYIRPEQLQQLETGMTPDQVQFLLGTPMLTGELPEQRWVYPIQQDGEQFEHLEVEFEGGRVARINRS
ncbi:outer membrane protein assembly factor BamE [Saccharospirillum mangrovi]|uniref:outer membrane protein assembly factor BamE n=1 Tax=Saccharospirillum mangrovi TaxID=2161747 RepID=UPI0013003BEA|nr:outer membrane protein assembly factor BamE [Saccharospirillum mangrovi]